MLNVRATYRAVADIKLLDLEVFAGLKSTYLLEATDERINSPS